MRERVEQQFQRGMFWVCDCQRRAGDNGRAGVLIGMAFSDLNADEALYALEALHSTGARRAGQALAAICEKGRGGGLVPAMVV